MNSLNQMGMNALADSHLTFSQLVQEGTAQDDVGLNQFGELAMRIDIAAEDVVLKNLRDYSAAQGQSIRVVSEEHGELMIGGNNPSLTVYLDGLDGSSIFRDSKGAARCGTMFALYEGLDPKFQDYLLGGIADHKLGRMVLAVKGEGIYLIDDGEISSTKASKKEVLDKSTKIYIDEGVKNYPDFPTHEQGYFYDSIKRSFQTQYLGSSAVYFFDFAAGEADVVLEYGRKNNLEHMVAYPLVTESGGVMEFLDDGSLGSTSYSEYCKINNGYPAVITAASPQLAQAIRDFV